MSTSFGVHIGNTSACIAVSKEGKTDVVANYAGDRYGKIVLWMEISRLIKILLVGDFDNKGNK